MNAIIELLQKLAYERGAAGAIVYTVIVSVFGGTVGGLLAVALIEAVT